MTDLFYVYLPKEIEKKVGNRKVKKLDKTMVGVFHSNVNARIFIAKQKAKGLTGYIIEPSDKKETKNA